MKRLETSLPEAWKKPAAIRIANLLLQLGSSRADRLTTESLLDQARRDTGLSDFGPGDIETPLSLLIESIHTEAELHALGRLITRTRLLGVLRNRLATEFWLSRHPEILAQNLYPPIVITGLQRTGTTSFQRLLAADPENRSLSSNWRACKQKSRAVNNLAGFTANSG